MLPLNQIPPVHYETTAPARSAGRPPKATTDAHVIKRMAHLSQYLAENKDVYVAGGIAQRAGVNKMQFSRLRAGKPDAALTADVVARLEKAAEEITRFVPLA